MSLITDTKSLAAICKKLAVHDFLTIDTEFLREKTYYPKLCLVQLAGPDIDAVAVDVLADGIDLQPLYDLMADDSVVKVFHAARQDIEIFYNLAGKVQHPLFDTQVAAMVCGHGESIGYSNLIRELCDVHLDKGAQFTDWSRRPLSDTQLSYALDDVTYLRDAYKKLVAELEQTGRTKWVSQEMDILCDPATYQNPPEEAWQRIKLRSSHPKTYVVLKELAAWREEEAQRRDIPRGRVIRDDALVDIAVHAPRRPEDLAKARNVSIDMAKGRIGREILERIGKALAVPKKDWPRPQQPKRLPQEYGPALEMLKMLLRIQASDTGVAAKLIASSGDLEALAQGEAENMKIMKGWRYEIFGREAEALIKGELSLTLQDGKIKKVYS